MSVEEIVSEVNRLAYPTNVRHVIISGGEPVLQDDLGALRRQLLTKDYHITLETNGTKVVELPLVLYSVSPKLTSSTPFGTAWEKTHQQRRINISALKHIVDVFDSYLKFVVASKEDIAEILDLVDVQLSKTSLASQRHRVYLMPEGATREAIQQKQLWVAELAQQHGFNYSPRLHIDLYDNKRGV